MILELIITDTSFYGDKDWLYMLKDNHEGMAMIPTREFYKKYGLKSPLTKQHLDSFDKGIAVDAEIQEFEGKRIVTRILKYHI